MKKVSDLSFIECKTGDGSHNDDICERLFKFWYIKWLETYVATNSEEDAEALSSDDFLNKRVLSLWDKDTPIAMLFLDSFKMNIGLNSCRRYFKKLPRDFFHLLREENYESIYSINGLIIDQDWRKSQTDLSISEILVTMGYAFAKLERSDVMVCYSRNERKMNKVVEQHNSIKFGTFKRHNRNVDFMYTPMKTARIFPSNEIEECCLNMLNSRHKEFLKLKLKHSNNNPQREKPH